MVAGVCGLQVYAMCGVIKMERANEAKFNWLEGEGIGTCFCSKFLTQPFFLNNSLLQICI
jgi:hypothetical protein